MWRVAGLIISAMVFLQSAEKTYENSLVLAPMYVEYMTATDQQFADHVAHVKSRIGTAPHVLLGLAGFLYVPFPAHDLHQPLTVLEMEPALQSIDLMVTRARSNDIVVHIAVLSGFFHGTNNLRRSAIRQDVRNAQWFADGSIGEWVTPSRYARLLHARMEEGIQLVGARLQANMAEYPETLVSVSGDGEVELSYERAPILADYSPFMIEEFRDWVRETRYANDTTPAQFNRDFKQSFTTWRLKYFDASGPLAENVNRMPADGPYFIAGGFDAPRTPRKGDRFWELWMQFRTRVIMNYMQDFASWINLPPAHYYSHQIPADFVFGEKNGQRLQMSASPVATALIAPLGSTGVTAFNAFDGKNTKKTATPDLFRILSRSSPDWGIFEYNPSTPVGEATAPNPSVDFYLKELRTLNAFKPHVIVPFAYSEAQELRSYSIKNSVFEAALGRFVAEAGKTPFSSIASARGR